MKKIIAAFDGLKFSQSTMDYAIHVARLINAHLVGIFLDDKTYSSYKIYDLITTEGATEKKLNEYEEKDNHTRANAVTSFGNGCRIAGVNYSIHHDRNIAIRELLHESIYADLLVINKKETLANYEENAPTRFIRDLLTDVQCPVLVVPDKYTRSDKIIMLYDGQPSSVYAVKMYNYIFTVPAHNTAEVISVRSAEESLHLPDNRLMKEFMKKHYPAAEYKVFKGLPEPEIIAYLKQEKMNTTVILGAYQRGRVARWFRPSMADSLMSDLNFPLFIAHSK